jgi:hypothetical protein
MARNMFWSKVDPDRGWQIRKMRLLPASSNRFSGIEAALKRCRHHLADVEKKRRKE